VIGIRGGIGQSRIARASALQLASAPFVEAAEAVGANHWRVLIAHMLPNLLPIILIVGSASVGANILTEASLSFLGYGVPPPQPTLGGMFGADSRLYMLVSPSLFIFPALSLGLIVFSVNMVGDALRDELDPRLRGAR
jgi:peptide/nickel transport system permease protein